MSVTVLVEIKVKPEALDDLKALLREILPGMRSYSGCLGVKVYSNQEGRESILLLERWDSREHYQKYVKWRKETGVLDRVGATLAGSPSIRYLDHVDV